MAEQTLTCDPGAASESMLVMTDSCENFQKMSSSLEEIKGKTEVGNGLEDTAEVDKQESSAVADDEKAACSSPEDVSDEDVTNNKQWLERHKHVFVLSMAGKPIYSRFVMKL